MNYTKEQRRAKFETLTEALKDAMVSEQTADAIGHIAEKYALTDEQTPKLAQEVGTVLLGFIPKEKLANELVAKLSLPPEQAKKVAEDIEKEIFENTPFLSRPDLPADEAGHKREYPSRSEGEGVSATEKTPLPVPPPGGGNMRVGSPPSPTTPPAARTYPPQAVRVAEPRPVPIRKEIPAPPLAPRSSSPGVSSLQTILSDIRRGTAYDEKRISDAFHKTPIEVRQTLESVGFLLRLENIAKKFGLNVEETGELVSESGLVMLGLTLPTQFVDNLAKRLRLPRDRAMAVGQAVNMEVLRPVREALRKMGQPAEVKPPLPIPPPGGGSMRVGSSPQSHEENGLRFAPSVATPSPSRPYPKGEYPKRSEGEGVSPSATTPPSAPGGHLPFQKGQEGAKNIYTTDPYREPIE